MKIDKRYLDDTKISSMMRTEAPNIEDLKTVKIKSFYR